MNRASKVASIGLGFARYRSRAVWLVLLAAVSPGGSSGCSCEGDARITQEDQVAADETMVNCQCAVNFDGLAQDFGGAPASLILDMPTCLPTNFNVHIADPARQAELRAMTPAEYQALIAGFCNTEVTNTVTAAIGFLKGDACGHFTVANCAPVDPSGMGGKASARNEQCEKPCTTIACDDTTCDPKQVAPNVSSIDVTKCACTELNGCGASSTLCSPPPAFDTGVGVTSSALTAGVMTRLATPTTHAQIDPGFSDASIFIEVCKEILGIDICTSDSANSAVGGYVNLVGRPCPGASCTMSLETWLKADDIDLEFDITVIEVGDAHIHDLVLTAITDPNAVQINADGTGVIPAGKLHITATGNESGDRFTFHDTNQTAVHLTVDYATGTFTVPGFVFNFDEGHATLDLTGSFAPMLTASAGIDQLLECNVFGGAATTLSGSSNASGGAAYSWWEGEAFGVPVQDTTVSGPVVATVAPLGATEYSLTVSGTNLQVATDSMVVGVTDTQAPVIVPHDVVVQCTSPTGQAVAVPAPGVSDVCDPFVTTTSNAPATFPLGDTTITWQATDGSGNHAQAASIVRVQDTTGPTIIAPAMSFSRCEPAPKTELLTVSVSDTCGTPAQVNLQGALTMVNGHALPVALAVNPASPSVLLPIGISTIRWTATDPSGNTTVVLQTVTVTEVDTAAVCCVPPYTTVVEGNDLPSIVLLPLTRSYCVFGRGGADAITTGLGADLISGGTGNDTLQSGTTNDVLLGRDGNDLLLLPIGDGRVYGGKGDDVIENTAGGVIYGNAGDDRIIGIFGTHTITPGAGRDFVDAGPGNDTVVINDLCEVQPFESLNGSFGDDTLISPVPVSTLTSMGVIVLGFEHVVVDTNRHHLAECF